MSTFKKIDFSIGVSNRLEMSSIFASKDMDRNISYF
jgi:hypothetical protein